jgi:hypothetical protein
LKRRTGGKIKDKNEATCFKNPWAAPCYLKAGARKIIPEYFYGDFIAI